MKRGSHQNDSGTRARVAPFDASLLTDQQRTLVRLLQGEGLTKTTIAVLLRPESVHALKTLLVYHLSGSST